MIELKQGEFEKAKADPGARRVLAARVVEKASAVARQRISELRDEPATELTHERPGIRERARSVFAGLIRDPGKARR